MKILFFVGLNEGIVPKTGAKGGILSDLDREALKAQDVELAPTLRERAYVVHTGKNGNTKHRVPFCPYLSYQNDVNHPSNNPVHPLGLLFCFYLLPLKTPS